MFILVLGRIFCALFLPLYPGCSLQVVALETGCILQRILYLLNARANLHEKVQKLSDNIAKIIVMNKVRVSPLVALGMGLERDKKNERERKKESERRERVETEIGERE